MKQIPFRDVHLDFHTSGLIPDVGADFDPAQFARTLTEAHVGSICVFARCHHGYCYYPTKVGTPHPGLRRRDLLGEIINSLRAVNISPGVYTTVVWDELTSQSHPEWRQVTAERKFIGGEGAGWKWLCMNTPYANWMEAHLREVLSAYSFDRLFVDIVNQWGDGCVCDHCLEDMRENGLDPKSPTDRRMEAMRVRSRFIKRMRDIVNEYNPEVLV
ncbi:beta-galactosidase, partial [bacterium]